MKHLSFLRVALGAAIALLPIAATAQTFALTPDKLPQTEALQMPGDIASNLVSAADAFLLKKIDEAAASRSKFWHADFSSPDAFNRSIQTNRDRFAHIIGLRDKRPDHATLRLIATPGAAAPLARGENFEVFEIEWSAFGDVHGVGLMAVPRNGKIVAHVIAIPDADLTPEQIFGLAEAPPGAAYARALAENNCLVIAPVIINRAMEKRRNSTLSNREFVYRPAFELGRHIIGYEVQKILALVDWMKHEDPQARIGVAGWGEGGLLALYAGALDTRIDSTLVSGFFGNPNKIWEQPIDRNVFGLLEQFGHAEIATMLGFRSLTVEPASGPEIKLPGQGGAPAVLHGPSADEAAGEWDRAMLISKPAAEKWTMAKTPGPVIGHDSLKSFLQTLNSAASFKADVGAAQMLRPAPNQSERMAAQIHELDRHSEQLLVESPYVRNEFMSRLDFSSTEKYNESARSYRDYFYDEVIGRFDEKPLPFNARTRKSYSGSNWTGYEVTLDVFPGLFAYGILLIPNDIKRGEHRPVVVCQHGLEGRPQDVVLGDSQYYHAFAAKLAERGFVTFAPQNLYIFTDRFRTLQRKANPIKKTLFSLITPQHQQIVDWLKTLPFVDPSRIGFYGLSYGGKTAMRVPALVTDYAFSICSADFNEWVWKNASTRSPYSYVWSGEYEIFEFDLGGTFNYAEMASLIAPRPFMVERGHFDNVAPDETVAYEFAKVQNLYEARLHLANRARIEWFVGPHTINGKGTFDFIHEQLNWPKPK